MAVFIILIGISNNTDKPNVEINPDSNRTDTPDDETQNTTSELSPITTTTTRTTAPKNSPRISKKEFESLKTGMTYNEVVSIIGGEGELLSQVNIAGDDELDIPGYDTRIYMWEGEGSIGANANVTFQNNKLVAKAQVGLR